MNKIQLGRVYVTLFCMLLIQQPCIAIVENGIVKADSLQGQLSPSDSSIASVVALRNLAQKTLTENPATAREQIIEVRKLAMKHNYPLALVWSDMLMASYFDELGLLSQQFEHLKSALKRADRIGGRLEKMNALRALSRLYASMNEGDKARTMLEKAIALDRLEKGSSLTPALLTDAAILAQHAGRPDLAMEKFREALRLLDNGNQPRRLAECLANLGRLEKDQGHFEDALAHLLRALELVDSLEDLGGIIYVNAMLANYYELNGDISKAMAFSTICYEKAIEHGGWENLLNAAMDVSLLAEKLGQTDRALEFARISNVMQDSIKLAEQKEKLIALEARSIESEHSKREIEVAIQRRVEAEKRSGLQLVAFVALGAGILILAIVVMLMVYYTLQRRKSNELLRHEIKERKASEWELNTFVYRSSHDLKGPLLSIKGLLPFLEEEDLSEEGRGYLQMIAKKTAQLDKLNTQLVETMGVLEAEIKPEKLPMAALWQDILRKVMQIPGAEEVSFEMKDHTSGSNGEGAFKMDPRIALLICESLIGNSVTYRDTAKARSLVEMTLRCRGSIQILSICDNGLGMTAEIRDRARNMFYMGSMRSTGNGLGLFLVDKLVRKMQGTMHIESEEGVGTEVRIEIPVEA